MLIHAIVDFETDSEQFWNAFDKTFPEYADLDEFWFTAEEWEKIQGLPGWDDNHPDYAPHPILDLEEEDEREVKALMEEYYSLFSSEREADEFLFSLQEVYSPKCVWWANIGRFSKQFWEYAIENAEDSIERN